MKTLKFALLIVLVFSMAVSCKKKEEGLSSEEIAEGLKEALKVGTDTSVTILHNKNGYFMDQAVKIFLPPEAQQVVDNINKVPGGQQLYDSLVLAINRSAEDAATEAKPIFVNAITGMTISDALGILHGSDSAATAYLRTNTYSSLKSTFQPKIDVSLNKDLVWGQSANDIWDGLKGEWNIYAGSTVGQLLGMNTVTVTLSEHVTKKGLNGLFLKVAIEEKDIRTNLAARVNDILRKVFAELDN